MATGTAYNARIVEDELSGVTSHLSAAIEDMKRAIAAIESAENEAEFKTPNLESLKGLMEVGFLASLAATQEWTRYRQARENSEHGL